MWLQGALGMALPGTRNPHKVWKFSSCLQPSALPASFLGSRLPSGPGFVPESPALLCFFSAPSQGLSPGPLPSSLPSSQAAFTSVHPRPSASCSHQHFPGSSSGHAALLLLTCTGDLSGFCHRRGTDPGAGAGEEHKPGRRLLGQA